MKIAIKPPFNIKNTLFEKNSDYTSRKLIDTKPNFKLNAYCINLKHKQHNMNFIHKEWKNFLNVKRFIALNSCTASHKKILNNIWTNRENENFPVVVMEDDVFRKNSFTYYWNQLLDIKNADYVTFDPIFVNFKHENIHKDFFSLKSHRSTGFIVYYKKFFDRFKNTNELNKEVGKTIDMQLTYNIKFTKLTPIKQVCRQIVNKYSTTAKIHTKSQEFFFKKAEKDLENFKI